MHSSQLAVYFTLLVCNFDLYSNLVDSIQESLIVDRTLYKLFKLTVLIWPIPYRITFCVNVYVVMFSYVKSNEEPLRVCQPEEILDIHAPSSFYNNHHAAKYHFVLLFFLFCISLTYLHIYYWTSMNDACKEHLIGRRRTEKLSFLKAKSVSYEDGSIDALLINNK
jgi:hypothetical protein